MDKQITGSTTDFWWTIRQAAVYLSVSTGFLRKSARTRRIPFVRLGTKALRFRKSDLDKWLEGSGSGGEAPYAKNNGR
jgi:excisionase family DNA binding protein